MSVGGWLPNTQRDYLSILDHGPRAHTDLVVIHCIEGSADGAIEYFRTGTGGNPGVGAHLVMGVNPAHTRQLVSLHDVCWHAVWANHRGPGIEHEGFSTDSPGRWLARRDMLHRSAARLAWMCHEFKLGPPRRGVNVFAHSDGGAAWGNHGDPGPGFPWHMYLDKAIFHYYRHWGR